jgi:hypothetical protein
MHGRYNFPGKSRFHRFLSWFLLAFMAIFMLTFASKQPFWFDELFSIGVVHNSDAVSICKVALEGDVHPPLFHLIVSLFYRVMPYGEAYLLLLPVAFVIGGIVVLGKTGRVIGGEDLGFFTLCVAATSSILVRQGGWELRSYSMLFCFSSVTLLYYAKRCKEETNMNIVFYGISLTLLLHTHYFGAILALFYGLMDLCLFLRKKIAFKCILSYLLAGLSFVPWFILVFVYSTLDLSSFWALPPDFTAPILTIAYLLSNSIICCFFFGAGFLAILFGAIRKPEEKQNNAESYILRCLPGGILWVIAFVFCYSKFINPGGGMYVNRYFFVILPHVFLITAYAAVAMCNALANKSASLRMPLRCFLLLLLLLVGAQSCYLSVIQQYDPYRDIAEYLSKDGKAHSRDSLTITTDHEKAVRGWLAYYFVKRGYEIPRNMAYIPEKKADLNHYQASLLHVFSNDGKTNARILTAERLLEYSRIYLLGELPSGLRNAVEQNYVLEETLFRPQPPNLSNSGFIQARFKLIRFLKNMMGFNSAPPADSSGSAGRLKIYTKRQP